VLHRLFQALSHHRMRCLLLVALTGSLLLATAGTASAQTTPFNAEVKNKIQRPEGCPDGAYLCGDAVIAGFGPAQFRWFLNSFEPVSQSCGDYTATVTFRLADGSTLTLDEAGRDCSPGNSFSSYPPHSYGQPQEASGTWEVQSGSGQFDGMSGSGTNTLRINGADFRATYTGALEG
jgi:hypothetical protein